MRNALLAATTLVSTTMLLVPAAQAFDWSGSYVGVTLGVVQSDGSVDYSYNFPNLGPDGVDLSGLGALAGVTFGYNYVLDQFVIGVEADASLSNLNNGASAASFPTSADVEEALKSLLTLRGRIGVIVDKALFYATAGVAGGQASSSSALASSGYEEFAVGAETSGFVFGVIGGAGVEYQVTDTLTFKIELLGYNFGSQDGVGDTGYDDFSSTYNPSGFVFRTGINFHF